MALLPSPPLEPGVLRDIRRRMIFEFGKWDAQVGDTNTVGASPLVLTLDAWRELSASAEAMSAELFEVERRLLSRPDLMGKLGLPRAIVRAAATCDADMLERSWLLRQIRFDFHFTTEGWRISEANTDVPGGYIESSALPLLVQPHVLGARPFGDPAAALVGAVFACVGRGATVGLVHATAYTDDRQVMAFLARMLEARGVEALLCAPDQVSWRGTDVLVETAERDVRADLLLRFFPAEWLPELGRHHAWQRFFAPGKLPISNPATALLIQSKRLPLVLEALGVPAPELMRRLPPTRAARRFEALEVEGEIFKPVLGRVGEGVGIRGVTDAREWKDIRKGLRWRPSAWIAQRRFESVPVQTPQGPRHACVGVYTVGGKACGAYGRVAVRPLIDQHAADAAVLVSDVTTEEAPRAAAGAL